MLQLVKRQRVADRERISRDWSRGSQVADRKVGRETGRGIGGVQLGIALEAGCRPVAAGSTVAAVYGSSNLPKAGRAFEVDASFVDAADRARIAEVRRGDATLDRARDRARLRRKFATQIVWC